MSDVGAAVVALEATPPPVVAVPVAESPKNSTSAVVVPAKAVDPVDRYTALAVRGAIVGVGVAGVVIFLKNSRIFSKFEHVSQIPKDFVRKELELKGRVREVLPSGELRVEHEPIMKVPFFSSKKAKPGLLNIRLAGVDLSQAGQQFLTKDLRLLNKPVTFTVIKSSEGAPESVDADVTLKKAAFGRTNLNIEVVRRGYARVPSPDQTRHLNYLQTIPAYSRLISRLLMSEKIADRRGVGVWERDTWVESVQSYPSQVSGIVKSAAITKALVLLFNVTRDVVLYGVKLTQQLYTLTLLVFSYISRGYRSFSRGVDTLSDKYSRVRQRLK
ncbi:unnamed protein product [Caenorhabditis auriculariae]|uniref:Uncharacterized protein n=1 Tax=Caenorhabditis auriculariae TaxID=2777116 RepID=A0A8S1HGL5_9PELO|nr:unnamed protein product [Caenorhabditis auriculariae]